MSYPGEIATIVGHLQTGRVAEAEGLCLAILQQDAGQADAWHLWGVAAQLSGDSATAAARIGRAVELRGDVPEYYGNLSAALVAMGRAQEAIAAATRAIELQPDYPQAMANLGNALRLAGRLEEAEGVYRRLLDRWPAHPSAANNLGIVLAALQRWPEAVEAYQHALAVQPGLAEAHYNLGNAMVALRRLPEAMAAFQEALRLRPAFPEAWCNLAIAWQQSGRLDEAIDAYRQALRVGTSSASVLSNLGSALQAAGRLEEALVVYRQAVQADPHNANVLRNFGSALQTQGRLEEAIEAYQQGLAAAPADTGLWANLAGALLQMGRDAEAEEARRRGMELAPRDVGLLLNLGALRKTQGRLAEAIEAFQLADECVRAEPAPVGAASTSGYGIRYEIRTPSRSSILSNLAGALQDQGRIDEALATFRQAIELDPQHLVAGSNYLLCLQYRLGITPEELDREHRAWDERMTVPAGRRGEASPSRVRPSAALRLGFVSADLRFHPALLFCLRVMEGLAQRGMKLFCYSNSSKHDELTDRVASISTYSQVCGMTDEQLARQIRSDRVDVLFDLGGHTGDNRLLLFARRPAPVQITWVGYEGTTGLAEMDYLLADRWMVPAGEEAFYRERVLRMPECYECYEPSAYPPPVAPPPPGPPVFGCFNNPAKLNSAVVKAWSEILRRLPNARLLLKYKGWNDPPTVERMQGLFAEQGIDRARIDFLGWSSRGETLMRYEQVHVALDPFPFSGGLTTCEALWMGVPVVTWPQRTFASRHGLSYLSTLGHAELVAQSEEQYIETAVTLATDRQRLTELRETLRPQMAASSLCDGQRFADALLALLQGLV